MILFKCILKNVYNRLKRRSFFNLIDFNPHVTLLSASITIANTKITQKKCLAFKKKGKKKVLIIFL
ncbi:MAG: hypothetical protein EAZ31_01535 [Cytophagia bacterium]|nr:MAG: hypothetical protein EAZ31_01535 [Cytophagia bacterium]